MTKQSDWRNWVATKYAKVYEWARKILQGASQKHYLVVLSLNNKSKDLESFNFNQEKLFGELLLKMNCHHSSFKFKYGREP